MGIEELLENYADLDKKARAFAGLGVAVVSPCVSRRMGLPRALCLHTSRVVNCADSPRGKIM